MEGTVPLGTKGIIGYSPGRAGRAHSSYISSHTAHSGDVTKLKTDVAPSTTTRRPGTHDADSAQATSSRSPSPSKKRRASSASTNVSPKRSPASSKSRDASTADSSVKAQLLENPHIKDRLGTLVRDLSATLASCASWEEFVHQVHGRSYLADSIDHIDHPARELLQEYRDHGVPVIVSDEGWTPERLQECLRRGAHPSAVEHKEFLRDEMADFCERGFWAVLPFDSVKDLEELKLSPSAVKPERDRRPRLINDHTWFGVNDATEEYVAKEVMQFGNALPRILHRVHHSNPAFGPVYLAKFDISDGFYRMATNPKQAPNLAVIMPPYDGEPQLVAIPLVCTMGWVNSPPSFSAMSETVADLANARLHRKHAPEHRLDHLADTEPAPEKLPTPLTSDDDAITALPVCVPQPDDTHVHSTQPAQRPLSYIDVFVDDFIGAVQGTPHRRQVVRRILLHAVDDVLAQPNPDEPFRQEAVSLKKLLKGDGHWDTRKLILGWIIDTVRRTIEMPAHRHQRLQDLFPTFIINHTHTLRCQCT